MNHISQQCVFVTSSFHTRQCWHFQSAAGSQRQHNRQAISLCSISVKQRASNKETTSLCLCVRQENIQIQEIRTL